jgi:hypothetical protein
MAVVEDVEADADEREDADAEMGREVVGVAVACRAARLIVKDEADGCAELREENVSFIFVSERLATGLSTVDQLDST